MRPRLGLLLVCVAALGTSACTVVGTALGAATPRYESVEWKRDEIPLGARVRVRVRNAGADSAQIAELEGRYEGIRDRVLALTDDGGHEHALATRDIVDVDVRSGTEWKKGLLVGAAADVLVAVAVVAITSGANVSIVTGAAP